MKLRAANQIAAIIDAEFLGIKKDVRYHLAPDVTVEHARTLLAEHVPALVVGRGQLLLDSLLSYLMEDAAEALADAPTDVKNNFYAEDLRARLKGSFRLEPHSLQFSFDPRVIAGGVAAGGTLVTGGLIAGLVLGGVVTRIVAGVATLVASAFAFRVAHSAGTRSARRALESDTAAYLAQSEAHVSEWLSGVERAFMEAFDKFAVEHGVQRNDAP